MMMRMATGSLLLLLATSLLLSSTVKAERSFTNMAKNNTRNGKVLGIFSVVRFPNDACTGTTTYNGTCYTSEECNSRGGTSSGACASGFGVCCTFTMACGSTTTENNTYHVVTSFSTTTETSPCTYKICPADSDVCKLRIDFSAFSIYHPWTSLVVAAGTAAYVPQGIVVNLLDAKILGDCLVDTFTVVSSGQPSPPAMCGIGPGQHMYVDVSPSCTNLNFNVDTDVSYTRSWSFTVKQVECSTDYGKHDCMQYMTGLSGTFMSWNTDTSLTAAAPGATNHHLNDQSYDICFRQERGYCKVCFSPVITTAASSSFGVSGSVDGPALKSGAGDAACTGTGIWADYVEIENLVAPTVTSSLTTGLSKFCGALFNSANSNAASGSACTFKSPFRWGVHFNDEETLDADMSGTNQNKGENNVAGGGGIGFNMNWWLESC